MDLQCKYSSHFHCITDKYIDNKCTNCHVLQLQTSYLQTDQKSVINTLFLS